MSSIVSEFGAPCFPFGGGHFAFTRLGRLLKMLMLFDIGQNSCFFAELIKTS